MRVTGDDAMEENGIVSPNVDRYPVFSDFDPGGLMDLAAIDTQNLGRSPTDIATSERRESPGDFSADGRYYAYNVDETVIVTPFPKLDRTFEIADAWRPRWTRDELFFLRGKTLMAMPISTAPSFERLGDPEPLFDLPVLLASEARPGTLATGLWPFPDGQRVLVDVPNPEAKSRIHEINVVVNWSEELKRRVPTGR